MTAERRVEQSVKDGVASITRHRQRPPTLGTTPFDVGVQLGILGHLVFMRPERSQNPTGQPPESGLSKQENVLFHSFA